VFELRWEIEAIEELSDVPAHQRARIWDEVGRHLRGRPAVPDRRRKVVRGLKPPWSDLPLEFWQLRVDPYRVFYDVDKQRRVVVVRAVRLKARGKTTKEIL
jgi:mRNA-degrading endonuclease RelE of RelBE toxin-antitoxin system